MLHRPHSCWLQLSKAAASAANTAATNCVAADTSGDTPLAAPFVVPVNAFWRVLQLQQQTCLGDSVTVEMSQGYPKVDVVTGPPPTHTCPRAASLPSRPLRMSFLIPARHGLSIPPGRCTLGTLEQMLAVAALKTRKNLDYARLQVTGRSVASDRVELECVERTGARRYTLTCNVCCKHK